MIRSELAGQDRAAEGEDGREEDLLVRGDGPGRDRMCVSVRLVVFVREVARSRHSSQPPLTSLIKGN